MNVRARTVGSAPGSISIAHGIPAELVGFVQKTYGLLAFSVILAAAACWGMIQWMPVREVITEEGIATVPALPSAIFWSLIIAEFIFLGMAFFTKRGARSGETSLMGLVALLGFVLCSGAVLGPLVGTYLGLGMASTVAAAGLTTAVTFTALSGFVLITGKDFSFMRGILFVGLFGLIAAYVVSIFFPMGPGFHWWYSAIGALLFSGFILYDTSNVLRVYGPNNMVVMAVIALYLDILNLFLFLLQLFGGSRD
ncbi:MAG: Bax inhibitor-1/YccA family protein [Planctomycetota bacterium]|jgi:FtsH-binding integral membrane protein